MKNPHIVVDSITRRCMCGQYGQLSLTCSDIMIQAAQDSGVLHSVLETLLVDCSEPHKNPLAAGTALFVGVAEDYMGAIHGLARRKDGKTLFEHSPTKDQDCFDAWLRLNDTGKRLREVLDGLKQGLPQTTAATDPEKQS